MKIDINIDEAEIIIDGLNLLEVEIDRYEKDELIPSMVREGARVKAIIESIRGNLYSDLHGEYHDESAKGDADE
jgi:hypothetical protein